MGSVAHAIRAFVALLRLWLATTAAGLGEAGRVVGDGARRSWVATLDASSDARGRLSWVLADARATIDRFVDALSTILETLARGAVSNWRRAAVASRAASRRCVDAIDLALGALLANMLGVFRVVVGALDRGGRSALAAVAELARWFSTTTRLTIGRGRRKLSRAGSVCRLTVRRGVARAWTRIASASRAACAAVWSALCTVFWNARMVASRASAAARRAATRLVAGVTLRLALERADAARRVTRSLDAARDNLARTVRFARVRKAVEHDSDDDNDDDDEVEERRLPVRRRPQTPSARYEPSTPHTPRTPRTPRTARSPPPSRSRYGTRSATRQDARRWTRRVIVTFDEAATRVVSAVDPRPAVVRSLRPLSEIVARLAVWLASTLADAARTFRVRVARFARRRESAAYARRHPTRLGAARGWRRRAEATLAPIVANVRGGFASIVSIVAHVVGASFAALAVAKRAVEEAAESRRARIREKAARRVDPALADGAAPTSPSVRGRYATRHATREASKSVLLRVGETFRRLGVRSERAASAIGGAAREWIARNAPTTPDGRRRFDVVVLASACLLPVAYAYRHAIRASGLRHLIGITTVICALCYVATKRLVGVVQRLTLKRGMFGYDINKRGTPAGEVKVPEAAGLAPAAVFLASLTVLQCVHLLVGGEEAKEWAVEHNSALATIGFAVFLGFVDDVLELPWRAKMILPAFASLPLLLSYAGSTTILVPRPLRAILRRLPFLVDPDDPAAIDLLELGPLYYLYMFLLAIFCTNSINIHAGINGLEAGQSAVIAAAMVLLDVSTIASTGMRAPEVGEDLTASMTPFEASKRALALAQALGSKSPIARRAMETAQELSQMDVTGAAMHDAHVFSLCLTAPFLACTLGLLAHNWYPSKVFVGDTYTYFAGMTLGVAGILGHYSETLVLFFLPQIANFLYSAPQLFKFVPCPRHRLPRLEVETGLLYPSLVSSEPGETRTNMNLVNLFLRILGPQTERTLCLALLTLQAGCCAAGFALRALLTGTWK